jgi:hypothetical protein
MPRNNHAGPSNKNWEIEDRYKPPNGCPYPEPEPEPAQDEQPSAEAEAEAFVNPWTNHSA